MAPTWWNCIDPVSKSSPLKSLDDSLDACILKSSADLIEKKGESES